MAFAPILFPAALAAGPEELRLAEETVATLVSNALHIFNPTLARNVPVVTPQALCEAAAEASQQHQQQHAVQPASAQLQLQHQHHSHQRHQHQSSSAHHYHHPSHLAVITTAPAATARSHHFPDPHEPASDPNFEPYMQDSTFLFALDSMVSDSVTSCLFSEPSDLEDFFFDAAECMSTLSLTASLSSELQLITSASGAAVSSLSDPLSPASSSACLSGTDGGASTTTTTSGGGDSQASGDIPCHTTLLDPHEHQHTDAHRQHRRQPLLERLVEVVPRRRSGSPRSPRSPRRAAEDGDSVGEGGRRQTKTPGASARSSNSNNLILTANSNAQQHIMGDDDAESTADADGNVICIIKAQPTAYGSGKSAVRQTVVPYKASADSTAGFGGAAERALAAAAPALKGVDVKTSGVLVGHTARHPGSVGGAAQRVTEGGADHSHGHGQQLQHRPLQRPEAFPQRRMSMGGHTDHGQHSLQQQQQVVRPVAPQSGPVGAPPPQRRQTMGGSGNGSGSPRGSGGGGLAPRNSCPASYYRHHHQLLVQQQQQHPHQHQNQPLPSATASPCLLGTAGHLRVSLLPGSSSGPPSLHVEPLGSPAASAHLVPLQQLDRAALQREKEVLKRQLKDVAAAYRAASGAELTPALKEPLRCVYVRYHRIKGLMAGEGSGMGGQQQQQQQHMVHVATALVA